MRVDATHIRSLFGALSVVQHEGVIVGASFQSLDVLLARLIKHYPGIVVVRSKNPFVTGLVRDYEDGQLDAFDNLLIEQPGGVFMQNAWKVMRTIKPGTVATYAQLAKRAGSASAVRAAGTACASNLVAPFVPCHRIVRSDGTIGNYGFGVELKRKLLAHEGVSGLTQ